MFRNKSKSLHLHHFIRFSFAYARQLCSKPLLPEERYVAGSSANLTDILEEKLKAMQQQQLKDYFRRSFSTSIYRVPAKLRQIEPKAYDPHFISIGPYHHGSPNLQASEKLKWFSLNRLISFGERPRDKLDKLVTSLEALEHQVRCFYSEDVELSKEEFVTMMLLDGCFIVDLFQDLNRNRFKSSILLSKRWMLPAVRLDLIALENQLPMIVLKKIFDETRTKLMEERSLEELALRFFDPFMPREEELLQQSIKSIIAKDNYSRNAQHLLDLFHSSITLGYEVKRGTEPHMYHSMTKLKEAGINTRVLRDTQPLDVRFEKGTLRIPSLQIDNHTASFLRNIVAYEQCHRECCPDMTAYLLFLGKLIKSTEDVKLLHDEGVILHYLGSNKQVAKLINDVCLELVHDDGEDSYLYDVVKRLDMRFGTWVVKAKARLKQSYSDNLWVGNYLSMLKSFKKLITML